MASGDQGAGHGTMSRPKDSTRVRATSFADSSRDAKASNNAGGMRVSSESGGEVESETERNGGGRCACGVSLGGDGVLVWQGSRGALKCECVSCDVGSSCHWSMKCGVLILSRGVILRKAAL